MSTHAAELVTNTTTLPFPARTRSTTAAVGDVCMLFAFTIGLALAVYKRQLLPARFFYDADRILAFINRTSVASPDGSYEGTARIYRALGLDSHELSVTVATYLLFTYAVVFATRTRTPGRPLLHYLLASVCLPLGAIFTAGYTKEVVVLLLSLLFLRTCRGGRQFLWFLAFALLYAESVREYWFITLGIYLALRAVSSRVSMRTAVLPVVVTSYLFLSAVFNLVLHVPLTYYRYTVVESLSVDPSSVITDPLAPGGLVHDTLNALLCLVKLAVPFPLLTSNPLHLVSFFLLTGMWGLFALTVVRHRGRVTSPDELAAARASTFLLAYLVTLSVFEPDFGSYLRHFSAVAPIMLFALYGATAKASP